MFSMKRCKLFLKLPSTHSNTNRDEPELKMGTFPSFFKCALWRKGWKKLHKMCDSYRMAPRPTRPKFPRTDHFDSGWHSVGGALARSIGVCSFYGDISRQKFKNTAVQLQNLVRQEFAWECVEVSFKNCYISA